jgi:hypothetical protein
MTRVMGSHFFTRDSRRSAASQPRILRGLRVECDGSMLALVLQPMFASATVPSQFSSLAINLGRLAAPVQEGERHELFIKQTSPQAQREGISHA